MGVDSKLSTSGVISVARYPLCLTWTFARLVTRMGNQQKLTPETQV